MLKKLRKRLVRLHEKAHGFLKHPEALEPGEAANLTLLDPAARRVIEPASLHSRSRNTPFAGLELPGTVHATFLRGAATVLDGKVVER